MTQKPTALGRRTFWGLVLVLFLSWIVGYPVWAREKNNREIDGVKRRMTGLFGPPRDPKAKGEDGNFLDVDDAWRAVPFAPEPVLDLLGFTSTKGDLWGRDWFYPTPLFTQQVSLWVEVERDASGVRVRWFEGGGYPWRIIP